MPKTPILKKHLGNEDNAGVFELENIKKIYSRVKPGLIRTSADEVTYPAHVILRYQLEKALINDEMKLVDLPEAWNRKMQDLLLRNE